MLKKLLAMTATLSLSSAVFAATTTAPTPAAPVTVPGSAIQYSHDANYIYVRQPMRLTLDSKQQAALQSAVQLISKQLQTFNSQATPDPSGDLKAISDSITAMNQKLDLLVSVAGQLYGEVAPAGIRALDSLPTGLMLFTTIGVDKGVLKFLVAGGSATFAVTLVPMEEQRITIKNPSEVVTGIHWDSSLVMMGVGNAGFGELAPVPVNAPITGRIGAGIIWGDLNSASDLHGLVGGPSVTVDLVGGMNIKLLALKNFDKPGAVNNYILMAGVERGNLKVESHGNVGYIFDAKSVVGGTTTFIGATADRISGQTSSDKTEK